MKMKTFDRELEAAAKRYAEPAAQDTGELCSPSLDARVSATLSGTGREEKVPTGRKIRWKVVMAAAAILLLLGACTVAAPLVKKFLNVGALSAQNLKRLDEVPEGWIGIYTAEDLDRIRDKIAFNYILMNDIEFTEADFAEGGAFEGGWVPIGTRKQPFIGSFNGNGYVVRGLRIRAEDTEYVGLFGRCQSAFSLRIENFFLEEPGTVPTIPDGVDPEDLYDLNGDGIPDTLRNEAGELVALGSLSENSEYQRMLWGKGGVIKNLGLEDAVIEASMSTNGYVGAIAGYADYLLGCYVKNAEIKVSLAVDTCGRGLSAELGVGGAAGGAYLADSCTSDARITVDGSADAVCETVMGDVVCVTRVGGVAGFSSACVTSYFSGEISCDPAMDAGVSFIRENDVPYVLPDSVFCEIYARLYPMYSSTKAYVNAEDAERITDAVRKAWKETMNAPKPAQVGDEEWYKECRKRFTEICSAEIPDISGDARLGWCSERFIVFYSRNEYEERDIDVQDFYLEDVDGGVFWQLDPDLKPREYAALSQWIALAFPDGDFEAFCAENHVKYGTYYCYDLRDGAECSFEGFDFGGIWKTEEGALPTLSIFGE